jgi:diaminohydroxyphosphoribosylaminopyrimidine deaminase/5-amino-6-(5-phosphoribosylamino)uracil reductase
MDRALSLALRGAGKTSPNPMVGAVVVKDGDIVGEGFHAGVGKDHAEVVALKRAGEAAAGATLYVTLEPCCHTGRTGPCTEAIIQAGIKRVVYPIKDPDPRVNGRGGARLRRAGISVRCGVLRDRGRLANEKYLGHLANGRPYVTLKTAQTLDGRIATARGDSQWLSGPDSLKFAHRLRAENDAVMVGMGTVRADNPSLTVRLVRGKSPYRVVLSRSLNFPRECRLLKSNQDQRTIIASIGQATRKFARRRHADELIFWELKSGSDGMIDLKDFLGRAEEFGLRSILVEGGGRLATSLLREGLVDKYVAIITPKVIGEGISSVGDLRIRKLSRAIGFDRSSFTASGADIIFSGYPRRRK